MKVFKLIGTPRSRSILSEPPPAPSSLVPSSLIHERASEPPAPVPNVSAVDLPRTFSLQGIKVLHDDGFPRNDLQTAMAVIQWLLPKQQAPAAPHYLLWDNDQPIPIAPATHGTHLLWDNGTPLLWDNASPIEL